MKVKLITLSIIVALIMSMLPSCLVEYFWHLKIENKTNKDIELAIYFNRAIFDEALQGSDYYQFLRTYGTQLGSQVKLISLDTDSLIGHYKISPNVYWEESGPGRQPDYKDYKRISITTANHVLTLPSHNAIVNNFKSDSQGTFIWQIK